MSLISLIPYQTT